MGVTKTDVDQAKLDAKNKRDQENMERELYGPSKNESKLDKRVGSYVGKETEREKKDNEKDLYRYTTEEFRKKNPVYNPDSPSFKLNREHERKYLESAEDKDDRVRKLKVIAAQTDENVPKEKAKYRRGHIATNEALYGMKKGGKVNSASARADGCAQRGKTRGKIV